MTVEIYLDDLKDEAKAEVLAALGEDGNYDIVPIAVIETEDEEEED